VFSGKNCINAGKKHKPYKYSKEKIMMPTMEKSAENRLSRLGVFLYTEQYSSEIFNKAQTYQN
jgi:hypothetical protein